jgi:hypothetical protein
MQQLGTSLAGGFSGGGGGGFSSAQISSEMNRAGTWSGQQRAMGNAGLSAADYADMYDSMSAWKSGSSTGR